MCVCVCVCVPCAFRVRRLYVSVQQCTYTYTWIHTYTSHTHTHIHMPLMLYLLSWSSTKLSLFLCFSTVLSIIHAYIHTNNMLIYACYPPRSNQPRSWVIFSVFFEGAATPFTRMGTCCFGQSAEKSALELGVRENLHTFWEILNSFAWWWVFVVFWGKCSRISTRLYTYLRNLGLIY
jgi:hypothetical protein